MDSEKIDLLKGTVSFTFWQAVPLQKKKKRSWFLQKKPT